MRFKNGYRMVAFHKPVDPTQAYTTTYHADITAPSGKIYEIEKIQPADSFGSDITLNMLFEGEKVPMISKHGRFLAVNDAVGRIYEEEALIIEKETMQKTKEIEEPDLEAEY